MLTKLAIHVYEILTTGYTCIRYLDKTSLTCTMYTEHSDETDYTCILNIDETGYTCIQNIDDWLYMYTIYMYTMKLSIPVYEMLAKLATNVYEILTKLAMYVYQITKRIKQVSCKKMENDVLIILGRLRVVHFHCFTKIIVYKLQLPPSISEIHPPKHFFLSICVSLRIIFVP